MEIYTMLKTLKLQVQLYTLHFKLLTKENMQKGFIRLTKKALISYLITSTAIVGSGLIYLFNPWTTKTAEAAWFNDNWAYRQAITVTVSSSSSDITDLETLITMDTSTPITASKMQSSCQDLRFTSQNGKILPYYIDSGCNSASTKIWVLADLVPKNTTTYTMYAYYNNPSAPAASDSNKFRLFQDLEGYWTLNDTSGNRTDSSVNGNALTDNNTVTSATGQYSNAGQFTAANSEYLSIADNTTLSTGDIDFTISTWVYLDSTGGNKYIVSKYQSGGAAGDTEYGIVYLTSLNRFRFFVSWTGNEADSSIVNSDNFGALSTGTWYFITAWHDSTANTINISVNNGTADSTSHSAGVFDGTKSFLIGARSGPGEYWDGRIDDVRLYKRVLTAGERTQLYTNPGTITTTAVGTSGPSTSFASEEKAPSPVARWDFEEGTGTSANDTSGNANTGTLTGGPTWSTGKVGKALSFDGSDDYVNIADSSSLDITGDMTLSGWFKLNSIPTGNGGMIISKDSELNSRSWNIAVSSGGKLQGIVFKNDSSYTWLQNSSGTTLTVGTWYFASMAYDSIADGSSTLKLYLNGKLEDSTTTAVSPIQAGNSAIQVGAREYASSRAYLTGYIDQVRIFNYARSAAQVAWDYNRGAPVGHWRLDECQGSVANDSSGNSNTGTITIGASGTQTAVGTCTGSANTAWKDGVTGKLNYSLDFDGTDDYVPLTNNSSRYSPGTGDLTVSAWVKPSAVDAAVHQFYNDYGTDTSNLVAFYLSSGDKFTAFFRDSDGDSAGPTSTTTPTVGNWYHVVGVRSGTTVYIYVNGIQENSATNASLGTISTDSGDAPAIGRNNNAASQYWSGQIDDVKIYNYALTATQVKGLYTGGAVRFGPSTGAP